VESPSKNIRNNKTILNTPLKVTDYGIYSKSDITRDINKTQRSLTKSVDLIRQRQEFNNNAPKANTREFGHNKTSTHLKSINNKAAYFKDHDLLSTFSGTDEWNEIEKYNAIAERYEKHNHLLMEKKNKEKLQESLRLQIIEQKRIKKLQLEQEKLLDRKASQLAKQEQAKEEIHQLQLKKKLLERKEMVENQVKARQMQRSMQSEDK